MHKRQAPPNRYGLSLISQTSEVQKYLSNPGKIPNPNYAFKVHLMNTCVRHWYKNQKNKARLNHSERWKYSCPLFPFIIPNHLKLWAESSSSGPLAQRRPLCPWQCWPTWNAFIVLPTQSLTSFTSADVPLLISTSSHPNVTSHFFELLTVSTTISLCRNVSFPN